jgi:glutathione peroxidase
VVFIPNYLYFYVPTDLPFSIMKLLLFSALVFGLGTVVANAEQPDVRSIGLRDIDGKETSLKVYSDKVILVVNVASECGYTRQYAGLEALYSKYKGRGLIVAGFPCNDFGAQEPGSNEEIKQFCSSRFKVTFPLFDKLHVTGSEQHPLYAALTGAQSPVPGPVKWNFGKFLIGRDGRILKRFGSGTEPDSAELTEAVEVALGKN